MDVDAVVLHSLNGYGVILSAILAYLQLVYQQQQEEGGGVDTKPCFNSPSISLYFTISLVSLGASTPPPPSKLFRICIFHLILACASLRTFFCCTEHAELGALPILHSPPPSSVPRPISTSHPAVLLSIHFGCHTETF